MAKILMTAIVADIRNKLNGSVFSKNRYGAYVRTKVTPVNPQSTAQQNVRNRLATNSQAWRALSEAQRQGWIDAAINFPVQDIYGNSKILAGNALYVRLNNNLLNAGLSALTSAPSPAAVPGITIGAITATAGTPALSVIFGTSPIPTGFTIKVETTGNVGPGKSFVKNLFRQIGYIAAAGTTPYDALAGFNTVHGALVAGQKVFVRLTMVNKTTGQMGIPVEGMVIVAA